MKSYEKVPDKRYGDQKLFWDGFQWVSKTTPIVKTFEQSTNTKKVQITGLPLELGLKAEDIKKELNSKLQEKYKTHDDIIQKVDLIIAQNAVAVELTSKEDIPKIKETFDEQKMLGQTLHVTSFEDKTIVFNVANGTASSSTMFNPIANSAKTAAQAAAIASATLTGMQGKEVKINLMGQTIGQSSKILKVWNAVDPLYFASKTGELQEVQVDIKEEFERYGKINDIRMIMPGKDQFGAELGSIFIEYENEDDCSHANEALKGRMYDNKALQMSFVKPDLYESKFKGISESFLNVKLLEDPQAQNSHQNNGVQNNMPQNEEKTNLKEADYEFEQ